MNPMYLLYALLALIAYKLMTLKASLTVISNKTTPQPLLQTTTVVPTQTTIISDIPSNSLPSPVSTLNNTIDVPSNQIDVENTYQPIVEIPAQPIYDYTDTIHFGTASLEPFAPYNYNQAYL